MFARQVSIRLKFNMLSNYHQTFKSQVLPMLRRQEGFKDAITMSNVGSRDVIAITFWENRASAEASNTAAYQEVLLTLGKLLEEKPIVQTFEAVMSTLHEVPVTQ